MAKAMPYQIKARVSDFRTNDTLHAPCPGLVVSPAWPKVPSSAFWVEVMPSKFYGQAERAISTGKLHALLRFHIQPIKHVVFVCPS